VGCQPECLPKVIFLTGVDSSAAALAAVRLGAEDWLVKPFEEAALLMQLEALLRPRRVIVRGGELGVQGTVGVLTFVRCGLSAEYGGVEPLRSHDPGSAVALDTAKAGCEVGMAALLSGPPFNMTSLSKATVSALSYVSRSYRDVSPGPLAETLGLSTNSLLQLFRREIGLTPRDYIARVRVEVIKQRLRLPDCPSLDRLAEDVGLCDGPHLSRVDGAKHYIFDESGRYVGTR
jgi:AraC-like DNA-binding protein